MENVCTDLIHAEKFSTLYLNVVGNGVNLLV